MPFDFIWLLSYSDQEATWIGLKWSGGCDVKGIRNGHFPCGVINERRKSPYDAGQC